MDSFGKRITLFSLCTVSSIACVIIDSLLVALVLGFLAGWNLVEAISLVHTHTWTQWDRSISNVQTRHCATCGKEKHRLTL